MTQTSNRIFDEFARLANDAAGVASGVRREVETMVRSQAERILRGMDVVTAAKARDENEKLAARVAALEELLKTQAPDV
jgi:BMFP domain-containing protein YqiC